MEGPGGSWRVRAIGWGRSGWARDAGAPLLRLRFTPAGGPGSAPEGPAPTAGPGFVPEGPTPAAGSPGDEGSSPSDGRVPPTSGPAPREILTIGDSLDEFGEDALLALLERARPVS